MMSPSHQSLQQQASINLPPLVKSPSGPMGLHHMTHPPSKLPKPSHIPRPTHSGNSTTSKHTLPPINGQGGQLNGIVVWGGGNSTTGPSKLPIVKDRTKSVKGIPFKTSKRDINYSRYKDAHLHFAVVRFCPFQCIVNLQLVGIPAVFKLMPVCTL